MVKPAYQCPRRPPGGTDCQFSLERSACIWCGREPGVLPLVRQVEVRLGAELEFDLSREEIIAALAEYLQRRQRLVGEFDATLRATHIGGVISHAVVTLVRKA